MERVSRLIPESVDADELLSRVHVLKPDLLELVQILSVPVHGRAKASFKDC